MTADKKKVERLVGIIKDKGINKEALNIVHAYPKIEKTNLRKIRMLNLAGS